MTNEEAGEYVLRSLGKGWTDVEITSFQLQDCVGDAFRWFNDRRGLRCETEINLTGSENEFDLSAVSPAVILVLSVGFPKATDVDLRAIYGDDLALPGVPWGQFPYGALQGGVYSSLVQAVQYRETASKIMSADLDWQFDRLMVPSDPTGPGKAVLRIFPGFRGPAGKAIVSYKAALTDFRALAADPRNEEFVLRRAVIAAKQRLGRVRGKYSQLPTARGERSLDGASLLSEAESDLQKLNDDLAAVNMPLPFLTA